MDYNLRRGSPMVRNDVRHLLCLLTKDNALATEELNSQLMSRIVISIRGHLSNPDFVSVCSLLCCRLNKTINLPLCVLITLTPMCIAGSECEA